MYNAHKHSFFMEQYNKGEKFPSYIFKVLADEHRLSLPADITWRSSGRQGILWDNLPPLHKRIAVMETIAHLECMQWEGKVQRILQRLSFQEIPFLLQGNQIVLVCIPARERRNENKIVCVGLWLICRDRTIRV